MVGASRGPRRSPGGRAGQVEHRPPARLGVGRPPTIAARIAARPGRRRTRATTTAPVGWLIDAATVRDRRDGEHVRAERGLGALAEPVVERQRGAGGGEGRPGVAARQAATATPPSRSIVSRFERSIALGLVGPRRQDDAATSRPRRARRLERQQRVVDRAQPGRAATTSGRPELDREVAHRVAARSAGRAARRRPRTTSASAPLAAARARPRRRIGSGSIALAGQLGGQVRRDRRAEAVAARRRVGAARVRGRGQQLVVGRPVAAARRRARSRPA